eukprot:scaffold2626_cov279-Pinguiococcus_pyrenoidosus.AAC.5
MPSNLGQPRSRALHKARTEILPQSWCLLVTVDAVGPLSDRRINLVAKAWHDDDKLRQAASRIPYARSSSPTRPRWQR